MAEVDVVLVALLILAIIAAVVIVASHATMSASVPSICWVDLGWWRSFWEA